MFHVEWPEPHSNLARCTGPLPGPETEAASLYLSSFFYDLTYVRVAVTHTLAHTDTCTRTRKHAYILISLIISNFTFHFTRAKNAQLSLRVKLLPSPSASSLLAALAADPSVSEAKRCAAPKKSMGKLIASTSTHRKATLRIRNFSRLLFAR